MQDARLSIVVRSLPLLTTCTPKRAFSVNVFWSVPHYAEHCSTWRGRLACCFAVIHGGRCGSCCACHCRLLFLVTWSSVVCRGRCSLVMGRLLFYLLSSCLVSSRHVSSRLVLSCLVLSCRVLPCLVLSCLVLSCLVLSFLFFSCCLFSCGSRLVLS